MNTREREAITLVLIQIAKDINIFFSSDENKQNPIHRSKSFLMSSFEAEKETILMSLLNDPVYTAKFSEEFLEKLLKKELRTMFDNLIQEDLPRTSPRKIARNTAVAIFHELDSYMTNLTVYLPITGIDLQLEEEKFEIGNITFQKMTQAIIHEIIEHFTSTVKVLKYSDEEKQRLIEYYTKEFNQIFQEKENQVYAIY